MPSRLLVEADFSIEQRVINRRLLELSPQPDFRLVYFLKSRIASFPPGASLLINPHQALQLELNRQRHELMLVRFAPALLIETATRLRLYRAGAHLLFRQPLIPLTNDARLHSVLKAMMDEMEAGAPGWREVIGAQIKQLAIYLLRAHINVQRSDEVELSRVGVVDRRLRRALEFMHDNCGRELALAEIAAAAYLSEFHFARLFKKIIGTAPHAYLAGLRIERARRLLAATDLPIIEVGAQVSYASQSHFTKIFREATGLTPQAFRHAAQASEVKD
jgi:AraC-like DNA-binding protein